MNSFAAIVLALDRMSPAFARTSGVVAARAARLIERPRVLIETPQRTSGHGDDVGAQGDVVLMLRALAPGMFRSTMN